MKKITSKIVALLLVLSIVPTAAYAVEGEETAVGAMLQVSNSTDKEIYSENDTAVGTITVAQSEEGATAENVVVSQKIVENARDMTVDNVAVKLNDEDLDCTVDMDLEGNGFLVTTNTALSHTDMLTITYDISMTGGAKGVPIVSQVVAQADNISEAMSQSVISIGELPTATLEVKKASEHETYNVGDFAQYTVTVNQTTPNAAAKEIVLKDTLDTDGAFVSAESVQVVRGEEDITTQCGFGIENNTLTIDTHSYILESEPLTINYAVFFNEPSLAGSIVTNSVEVTAEGLETVTAQRGVSVSGNPTLSIVKSADKANYSTGETANYSIDVTEVTGNGDAANVVLTDVPQGGEVNIDSIQVWKNGIDITGDCVISAMGDGFTVQLGNFLGGEAVTVDYSANITAESGPIINTATVSGDNTNTTSAEVTCYFTNEEGITISKTSSSDECEANGEMDYEVIYSKEGHSTSILTDVFSDNTEVKDLKVYERNGEELVDISRFAVVEFNETGFVLNLNYATDNEIMVTYTATLGEEEGYTNTATVNIDGDTAKAENTVTMSGESGGSGDSPKTGDILFMAVAIMALAGAGYAVSRKFSKA